MDRPRPAPLAIPLECVSDGLPFVEVVEAYPLNGEFVEEQGNTAHVWPDESEPPCRDELRDDACWHWAPFVEQRSALWRRLLPIAPLVEWQE